jgi:uncharacterized protein DUF3604
MRDGLLAGIAAPHHPSDGGGRAWLEQGGAVEAGASGSWTIAYEAGPLGIAKGGSIYLQVSPFWGWGTPQVERSDEPNFTRVETDAAGVECSAATLDRQLLGIELRGRGLASGERVRIHYGEPPLGARADAFAEQGSRFWIAVDGDGDGVRRVLEDSPGVDVLPGPAEALSLIAPTTGRPGEQLRLSVALLDASANAGLLAQGAVELEALSVSGSPAPTGALALQPGTIAPAEDFELLPRVELRAEDRGARAVPFTARKPGTYRLRGRIEIDGRALEIQSNPIVISTTGPRILWADLHGHSGLSDGTGTPEDYYRYARDVANLDVAALTDHDHWGILFLDEHPAIWEGIRATARRFHEPGRFVTLLGFEWTNWIHGHRHVLYFTDEGELLSSLDPRYDTPAELWAALRGKAALTVPHHTAGGPIALDWSIAPDAALEPVTEVASVHGSSEAADSPRGIYDAVPGHFARDALARGYRLGFIGSGDTHDGHPGLGHLGQYPCGGLAAILSEDCTREGVLAALRARRVYATTGERILLRFALGSARMGESVRASDANASPTIFVRAVGTSPIQRVELIRNAKVEAQLDGEGSYELSFSAALTELRPGEFVYVRVRQTDGGLAWSSPVFIE